MAIEKFKLAETDAYLNFAVPDIGSAGDDTLTVSGTITLVWANLGGLSGTRST